MSGELMGNTAPVSTREVTAASEELRKYQQYQQRRNAELAKGKATSKTRAAPPIPADIQARAEVEFFFKLRLLFLHCIAQGLVYCLWLGSFWHECLLAVPEFQAMKLCGLYLYPTLSVAFIGWWMKQAILLLVYLLNSGTQACSGGTNSWTAWIRWSKHSSANSLSSP